MINNCRSVAQPGSALYWGCRGRGFKSRHSDQLLVNHFSRLALIGFPFEAYEM